MGIGPLEGLDGSGDADLLVLVEHGEGMVGPGAASTAQDGAGQQRASGAERLAGGFHACFLTSLSGYLTIGKAALVQCKQT